MAKLSEAARAAAVMHFVSDDGDSGLTPERAVELFDELGQTFGPIDEVLDKYEVRRWGMLDAFDDAEWWEQMELLAHTIDAMFDYYEFKTKDQHMAE